MARWQPPSNVGKHELIGRRLFDEPLLAGSDAKRPFVGLDLRNFEEKRDDQTSLDRLGRTGIERSVMKYLQPRAKAAGNKFKPTKPFNGWAVVQAQHFENIFPKQLNHSTPVVASPVLKKDLEENIYHAHVVTPDGVHHYSMALHLRALVEKHGFIEHVQDAGKTPLKRRDILKRWILQKWSKILRVAN